MIYCLCLPLWKIVNIMYVNLPETVKEYHWTALHQESIIIRYESFRVYCDKVVYLTTRLINCYGKAHLSFYIEIIA